MSLDTFIEHHRLPASFVASAERCYLPYASWLSAQLARDGGGTFVLGINGAQGTGKSTLAHLLAECLTQEHGHTVVVLSIDDIYLSKAERQKLGEQVHPLLATRGVPGTHDVALGIATLEKLRALQKGELMSVPAFDKAIDDCVPKDQWPQVAGPVDLVILEGWCVASQPSDAAELDDAVNALETSADPNGTWRAYVNDTLATKYAPLFAMLDSLLFLQVPGFEAVYRWRLEQEHKLRDRCGGDGSAIMSDQQVAEFIQLFERITRSNLKFLPLLADAIIELGDDHQAIALDFRTTPP